MMMNIEEQVILPIQLLDHNYFLPVVHEIGEQAILPIQLLDHNYFLPVVNENEADRFSEALSSDDDDVEIVINDHAPETYRIVPGIHHLSRIFIDNVGFKYYKRETREDRIYLVCERQKNSSHPHCPGTAVVSTDAQDNSIAIRNRHNHVPSEIDINVPFLREVVGGRGIDSTVKSASVRTLYNEEIVNHQEAASSYTFMQARERVKRMRRLRRPCDPQTIEELVEALINPYYEAYTITLQNPPSRFFLQDLVVEGTRTGVIFANMDSIRRYQEELATVTVIGIDGTFKTVPQAPLEFRKGCFLTIQVVFKSVSFPMVYVLLSSMTEETYTSLFNIVRNILPLNYNAINIVTDYERGLMNAVQRVFPESKLRCCWFHFSQAIVRYCRRRVNSVLDMVKGNPIAARVLRMVLALPHLPAARGHPACPNFSMRDGFRAILQYVQQFPEIERGMRTFLIDYIENFWFLQVGPEFISVFGEEFRTNNYLESFHSTLLVQLGKHPNIWDFIQKLKFIENQYYVEMDQARRNLRIRDVTSRAERTNTTRFIRESVQQLNEDEDLLMFLRRTGHRNDDYIQGQIGPYPDLNVN